MESNTLAETFELNTEDLIKAAIENGEGTIASNGALSLETGARTGGEYSEGRPKLAGTTDCKEKTLRTPEANHGRVL